MPKSSNRLVCAAFPALACVMALATAATTPREAVWAAETAFARSMAQRDLNRFGEFVSDEAVFISGTTVLTGKQAVIAAWSAYFKEPTAPFSWEPDQVEVLASGTLALSTGPVRDPDGKAIARFHSIWRLETDGAWRVVFDKGGPPSPGPQ